MKALLGHLVFLAWLLFAYTFLRGVLTLFVQIAILVEAIVITVLWSQERQAQEQA